MTKKSSPEKKDLSFEQAVSRLEEIVAALESGEPSLEQAIALFEEGTALSRFCQESLTAAQGKIEKLVETARGLTTQEIEISPDVENDAAEG